MSNIVNTTLSTMFVKHIASSSLVHTHFQREDVYATPFESTDIEFEVIGKVSNIKNGILAALRRSDSEKRLELDFMQDEENIDLLKNFFGADLEEIKFTADCGQEQVILTFHNRELESVVSYIIELYYPSIDDADLLSVLSTIHAI